MPTAWTESCLVAFSSITEAIASQVFIESGSKACVRWNCYRLLSALSGKERTVHRFWYLFGIFVTAFIGTWQSKTNPSCAGSSPNLKDPRVISAEYVAKELTLLNCIIEGDMCMRGWIEPLSRHRCSAALAIGLAENGHDISLNVDH